MYGENALPAFGREYQHFDLAALDEGDHLVPVATGVDIGVLRELDSGTIQRLALQRATQLFFESLCLRGILNHELEPAGRKQDEDDNQRHTGEAGGSVTERVMARIMVFSVPGTWLEPSLLLFLQIAPVSRSSVFGPCLYPSSLCRAWYISSPVSPSSGRRAKPSMAAPAKSALPIRFRYAAVRSLGLADQPHKTRSRPIT